MEKAIIGGTGVYSLASQLVHKTIQTDYGAVPLDIGTIGGEEIAFLPRHGKGHSTPPHLINYRANMQALKNLGVKHIYATATVGSCHNELNVGDIVVIDDFLDFTKSRICTFYGGKNQKVAHTDMSDPYCNNLRKLFINVAKEQNVSIKEKAVYLCTEGPRFETSSEIKFYQKIGADVIGMTSVPEVILAKELGMCYASIGMVSNMCTGIENKNLAEDDLSKAIGNAKSKVFNIFIDVFKEKLNQDKCTCNKAVMYL